VTQEVVPVLGLSALGFDFPLKMNLGRQAESDDRSCVDSSELLPRPAEATLAAESRPSKLAEFSTASERLVPEVTLSYQGQVALDDRSGFD
jgi:hypothetical protein